MITDYYEILEIKPNASIDDIKQSFRRLAKMYHPDTSETGNATRDQYEKVREAYSVLSDSHFRVVYDKERKSRETEIVKENQRRKVEYLDDSLRLEIILAWSTTKNTFNSSFCASCLNQLASGKKLSPKQKECIENILISFKIDIDYWIDEKNRNNGLENYFANDPFKAFEVQ